MAPRADQDRRTKRRGALARSYLSFSGRKLMGMARSQPDFEADDESRAPALVCAAWVR
ncbi:MAG TPA: hypothetical protein VER12_20470 [Polyangiaceae bacterium]|nr:hypothetical protein [Polyangiaceae bacterium]